MRPENVYGAEGYSMSLPARPSLTQPRGSGELSYALP